MGDTRSLPTSCELTLLADPVACATPLDEDVALEIDVSYTDVAEFDIDTEIDFRLAQLLMQDREKP